MSVVLIPLSRSLTVGSAFHLPEKTINRTKNTHSIIEFPFLKTQRPFFTQSKGNNDQRKSDGWILLLKVTRRKKGFRSKLIMANQLIWYIIHRKDIRKLYRNFSKYNLTNDSSCQR